MDPVTPMTTPGSHVLESKDPSRRGAAVGKLRWAVKVRVLLLCCSGAKTEKLVRGRLYGGAKERTQKALLGTDSYVVALRMETKKNRQS